MDNMDPFTQRMLERARIRREKLESKLPQSEETNSQRKPLMEKNQVKLVATASPPKSVFKSPPKETLSSKVERKMTINSPSGRSARSIITENVESSMAVEINIVHQNNVQVEVQVEEREVTLSQYLKEKEVKARMNEENFAGGGNSNLGSTSSFYSLTSADSSESELKADLTEGGKSRLQRLGALYSDGKLSSPIHQRTELAFCAETATSQPSETVLGDRPTRGRLGRLAALADHINNWEDDMSSNSKKKPIASSAPSVSSPRSKPDSPRTQQVISLPTILGSPANTNSARRRSSRLSKTPDLKFTKTQSDTRLSKTPSELRLSKTPSNLKSSKTQSDTRLSKTPSDLKLSKTQSDTRLSKTPTASPNRRLSKTPSKGSVDSNTYDKKKPNVAAVVKNFQAQIIATSPKKTTASNTTSKWDKSIIADLESKGFKRVSVSQSRLVYDFSSPTPSITQGGSATPPGAMASAVIGTQPQGPLVKRPSIKKYRAPIPPENPAPPGETPTVSNGVSRASSEDNLDEKVFPSTPELSRTRSGSISSASNRSSPLPREKRAAASNASSVHSSPGGNVMTKAALFETASPARGTDPALMSMRERKALFERNKGAAIVPKAAFGMAAPIKALQANGNDKAALKKPTPSKPRLEPKPSELAATHSPQSSRVAGALASLLGTRTPQGQQDIAMRTRTQRDQEMRELNNRFHKEDAKDLDAISPDETADPEEEDSPLMGGAHKTSCSSLVKALRRPLQPPPPPLLPREETDAIIGAQPTKRSSTDSPQVVSVLEDVKRIRVVPPKGGGLYPSLSDIEGTTEGETGPSCPASLNTSSDSTTDPISEEWGNTSFGRDLLQVVRQPVKEKPLPVDTSSDNSALDGLLDDLDYADDTEDGPTPPKINKNTAVSHSFNFKKGSDLMETNDRFKSPLKTPPKSTAMDMTPVPVKPLVHTVSFYRRQQSQTNTPSTPVRVVRHESEEPVEEAPPRSTAQDTRRRVKDLLEEVAKQNTVISQASQALNLCASTIEFSGSTEQAEGERLLLLATHRRQAFLHEVQRVQVEGATPESSQRCSLSIRDISLPLRREYVRQLNADGAVGHYLVCLVKCQERVVATSLARTAPESFSVNFPDKINLQGLDTDFKVTVEVYALQASKEILPHDVKYHIATKKSGKLATPRKGARGADLRAPPPSSPAGPAAVRAPALQPHGYCIFSHNQMQRNSFSLNKACGGGPLEGMVKLTLVPSRCGPVAPPPTRRGFLTMLEEAGGFGAWHRRWCVLHAPDLSYWRYPDDEHKKPPMGSIELATSTSDAITLAPRDLCARPHTLLLEVRLSDQADSHRGRPGSLSLATAAGRRHLLSADTKEERIAWAAALTTAVKHARDCD